MKILSPDPRKKLRADETNSMLRSNNRFDVQVSVPTSNTCTDCFVIVNGFDEVEDALATYYDRSFGLTQLLESKSIASVLIPIPFHHWRRPMEGIYAYPQYRLAHFIAEDLIRFYLGYKQLIQELEHVAKRLLRIHHPSPKLPFKLHRLHLLGYSLGGLAALAAFVLDRKREQPLFTSCTLLFSGATLGSINSRGTTFTPAQRTALLNFYTLRGDAFLDGYEPHAVHIQETNSGRLSAFQCCVLGQEVPEIQAVLRQNMNRIPIIVGQADHIMPLQKVLRFIPPEGHQILVHTEPGVGHFLFRDEGWKNGGARDAIDWLVTITDKLV